MVNTVSQSLDEVDKFRNKVIQSRISTLNETKKYINTSISANDTNEIYYPDIDSIKNKLLLDRFKKEKYDNRIFKANTQQNVINEHLKKRIVTQLK